MCSFVSPFSRERDLIRTLVPEGSFFEVHVTAGLDTLEARDTKGLYVRAARGEVELTGVNAPYEAPSSPELLVDTSSVSVEDGVRAVLELLREGGTLGAREGPSAVTP